MFFFFGEYLNTWLCVLAGPSQRTFIYDRNCSLDSLVVIISCLGGGGGQGRREPFEEELEWERAYGLIRGAKEIIV